MVALRSRGRRFCGWHFFLRGDEVENHENHADRNRRISDVENRPPADIQEIGHVALLQPIQEITQSTSELQPQRNAEHERFGARGCVDPQQYGNCDDRHKAQDVAVALEETEGGSCVAGVGEAQEPFRGPRLAPIEPSDDDGLGGLIEDKDDGGENPEHPALTNPEIPCSDGDAVHFRIVKRLGRLGQVSTLGF